MEKRRLKRIALYPAQKDEIGTQIREIAAWLKDKDMDICMPADTARFFGLNKIGFSEKNILKNADMVLSLGGDGTFLRAARFVCGRNMGVVGINLGGKGFLTEISFDDFEEYLELLIKGRYEIEARIMLDCEIMRGRKKIFAAIALNDVVMSKGAFEHLLKIKTYINNSYAASFRADGLIVSTPTGSTAYSISAGGPIISADADCLAITAICPHTLSARPLVVSAGDIINITEENASKVDVIIDGQIRFVCSKNDKIIIKKSKKTTKLIRIKKNFYAIVREKLRWVE